MKKHNRISDDDINEAVLWEQLGPDESFRMVGSAKMDIKQGNVQFRQGGETRYSELDFTEML